MGTTPIWTGKSVGPEGKCQAERESGHGAASNNGTCDHPHDAPDIPDILRQTMRPGTVRSPQFWQRVQEWPTSRRENPMDATSSMTLSSGMSRASGAPLLLLLRGAPPRAPPRGPPVLLHPWRWGNTQTSFRNRRCVWSEISKERVQWSEEVFGPKPPRD